MFPFTYNINDVHAVDKYGRYLYKRTESNQVDLKPSKDLLTSEKMREENLRIAVACECDSRIIIVEFELY
ncbi:hypothetical protein FOXYSP1_04847 [Fusarium oxysporum f. sp. phaseoli]